MKYNDFGKTGLKISKLGFGCMRIPEKEENGVWSYDEELFSSMIRHGYELGINYFDTAFNYGHQNNQAMVGKAVKPFRDKILLSTKIPVSGINSEAHFRETLENVSRVSTLLILIFCISMR